MPQTRKKGFLSFYTKIFRGILYGIRSCKRGLKEKKGTVIGRLCTVNPIENERYHLRVLLNNIRSPTSFDSLRFVNEVYCETFQKAAHMRGLLQNK
ncbi:hypothetical protein LIER_26427 [Lithospermum erythrorhizon]|uniref:Ribosomal protein L20 n=1 Tax=Lithospermum erythrorhizon TaxID=34254 RepID=A0AAV3R8B7_LITER